ncbi:efflux RND transporter periplasmic adaptor subunit [Aridibaculum aurantiacum]|uniref:efflux RND transporter periplasmic adaptor subunit n=1 Tax=Aridibaculum aurantiacum TaxID=2810307 RepID=UPI001A96615B|nr:efflux RND transporter periplasmic adaptor subunit [Aridibaculum aurantiacum]
MKKRSIVRLFTTILIIAGSVGLIGWILTNNKKKNEAKTAVVAQSGSDVAVRVEEVKTQNIDLDFAVNGNFAPAQQMDYAAESSGRVVRVLVDEGSNVRRGQTLAIIDAGTLNVDLESAQATLQSAQRDLQRYENAYKTGGVTQQQLDQARLAVQNAQARVSQSKIRVGDANVRSSINGFVNKRYIEPGAFVSPGAKLFELVDVSKLKLAVIVNENQVAQLKVGDPVQVKASVFPDKNFTGRVSFIAAKADAALSFPVEVEIANTGSKIKAGMYGTAMFDFPGQAPVVVVPRSAFVGGVNNNQLFVLDAGNIARTRKVIAGRIMGDQVEVLQGLSTGDKVITSGQINIVDGTKVEPIQ